MTTAYPCPSVPIRSATEEVRETVTAIIAAQMAEALSRSPAVDLTDTEACAERLHRAGFSGPSIASLMRVARAEDCKRRCREAHAASVQTKAQASASGCRQ